MSQQMTLEQAFNLALRQQRAGQLREAEMIYRQILAAHPNHPDALHLLGLIAMQNRRDDVAADLIGRAIAVNPSSADYYCNYGSALLGLGRTDDAIAALQTALQLRPNFAEAHFNLGNAMKTKGQLEQAIAAFRAAVQHQPAFAAAHNNLGMALHESNRLDEAIQCVRQAVALQPNFPEALNNLGTLLQETDRIDESIAVLRQAASQNERLPLVHYNLANAFRMAGEFEHAVESYRRAIALDPNLAIAHYNLGLTLLLLGDFEQGWREYEYRFDAPELLLKRHRLPQPRWDGKADLSGKRILIIAEQGFGDLIQFSRFIPLLAQRGGEPMLVCPREMARLMQRIECLRQVTLFGQPSGDFDLHASIMDLGRCFEVTTQNIPTQIPYLRADAQRAKMWNSRLSEIAQGKLKVGLAWAGRPTNKNDRLRSIPAQLLLPLAQVPDVHFVSLQKGDAAKQIAELSSSTQVTDWTDELSDFADTADLIDGLDLLITVDTAVAHLAAAMGKTVWLMLPTVPDWRWLLDRSDSPWYPTMRLFRQKTHGDWTPVIQEVVQQLSQFKITRQ